MSVEGVREEIDAGLLLLQNDNAAMIADALLGDLDPARLGAPLTEARDRVDAILAPQVFDATTLWGVAGLANGLQDAAESACGHFTAAAEGATNANAIDMISAAMGLDEQANDVACATAEMHRGLADLLTGLIIASRGLQRYVDAHAKAFAGSKLAGQSQGATKDAANAYLDSL